MFRRKFYVPLINKVGAEQLAREKIRSEGGLVRSLDFEVRYLHLKGVVVEGYRVKLEKID